MKKRKMRKLLKLVASTLIDVCQPGTTVSDYDRARKLADRINRKLDRKVKTKEEGLPLWL